MADLYDYLQWRGDLTFSQAPVNPVDTLIFSALSYISFGGSVEALPEVPISLKDAAEEFFRFPDQLERCRVKNDISLLQAAVETPRFRNIMLLQYRSILIPEEETQFAAITFLLDDNSGVITFRGTDYTLVGWKEDFNMTFRETIPSQILAQEYTREIGSKYIMPLRICGHSKGGNLAVFAAVKSEESIRNRICEIYNHDGPGFTEYMMSDPAYKELAHRIRTIVPQSSVIGMLLEHEEPYTIIKSNQVGIMQHDPYSWQVLGPNFQRVEELTADSRFLDRTFKNWLSQMSNEERSEFFDTVFELLESTGAEHTGEIIRPQNVRAYLKTLKTNEYMRNVLASELVRLVSSARQAQSSTDSETPAIPNKPQDETL